MAGGPPRLLVAKPGLDGHSNGAEQIAVAARDAGMEVVYQGIRLTPEQIAAVARDEDVDVIGLSILSGSHLELVPEVLHQLHEVGVDAPVVVGGIIPEDDRPKLLDQGVRAIYTPKDFELGRIMGEIADLSADRRSIRRPFGLNSLFWALIPPPAVRRERVDRRAFAVAGVGLFGLAVGIAAAIWQTVLVECRRRQR